MINNVVKNRLKIVFFIISLLFFLLIMRIGYIQLIDGHKLTEAALSQQTRDQLIDAKRGTIYDRNGKELAVSVDKKTVWAKPSDIISGKSTKAEQDKELKRAAGVCAKALNKKEDEVLKQLKSTKNGLVKIQRWITEDESTTLMNAVHKNNIKGIWTVDDSKRYYPFGSFASYVLGHVSSDNTGVSGVELEYDEELKGLPGRMIVSTDTSGREIPLGSEKYNKAQDGVSVVLTIDEVIQHYTEKAIETALEENKAKKAYAIVMDPKTGDILAMAAKPDYNPNTPQVPTHPMYIQQFEDAKEEDNSELLYAMWRNPMINDVYEPGSTFKLITSAAGIEEGVVTPDETFYDKGYIEVADRKIRCWRDYNPHGVETFTQAIQNSCNPIFVEVAQRLGVDTFYEYIDAFGLTKPTGIDLPGEASGISYPKEDVGPVELATISFGQGISVNSMQMLNAVSAIANDGKLMRPKVVKEFVDSDGNVVERFEPEVVRQVISKETSETMLEIMESVVTEGSGGSAYIPGYRVGAKTATAQKVINGKYGGYIASFIGVAPVDDPQVAVLVAIDEPQGSSHFGSVTGGPVVREILYETLRYLDVKPSYSESEKKKLVKEETIVPEVRNMSLKDASNLLTKSKLNFTLEPDISSDENSKIVDMFPKPGTSIPENSSVVLYVKPKEELDSDEKVVMPDLTGKTIKECTNIMNGLGLKIKPVGSGKAVKQNPAKDSLVDKNSLVSVEFK